MTGEDAHLEADYEDRNGDPHGIGSPEWEEYDGAHGYPDDDEEDEDDTDDIEAFLETRFGKRT